MAESTLDKTNSQTANRIGVILSVVAGILWVIYGMTGSHHAMLVVNIVISMLVGLYWAFGRDWITKK